MMTEKEIIMMTEMNEIGEQVLGVKGDFMFNPVALEDGFGISPMKTLKEVEAQAVNTNYYTREVAGVTKVKPQDIEDKVAPVAVKPVAQLEFIPKTPNWTKALYVAGFPAGLLYAAYKKSGFWGYVGYGIVGGIVFSIPYNYYANKK